MIFMIKDIILKSSDIQILIIELFRRWKGQEKLFNGFCGEIVCFHSQELTLILQMKHDMTLYISL